jgi:hypothetical protein
MKVLISVILSVVFICTIIGTAMSESVYELRKLSEDDWMAMNTEERLTALATTTSHVPNQTFLGDFGYNYDLYKRWGYDFYEMEDRYENYSFRDFEAYNILEERRQRWSYNEFGDRIAKMQTTFNIWQEMYLGDNTFYVWPTRDFVNGMADMELDGVWVAQEATDDWAVSINAARSLRINYTPLTFNLPNMQAVSFDFQSGATEVGLVTSSMLGLINFDETHIRIEDIPTSHHLVKIGGVMLRGGNIRRKFGALTLGATYVNQYAVHGNREGGDDWFGTVNNYSPTPVYVLVRFLDDSPTDNEGGPIIYDVSLQVDGRDRPDIIPTVFADNTRLDKTTLMTTPRYSTYLTPNATGYTANAKHDHMSVDFDSGLVPKFVDYLNYSEAVRGYGADTIAQEMNISNSESYFQEIELGVEPISVSGTETVVFMWDLASITSSVERVRAVARVSNDYLVQSSFMMTPVEAGGHDTTKNILAHYRARYWRNVAQAEGNIKDESNLTTVHIDFGYQVASLNYGVNAQFNYLGFKLSGEFVTNENHFMYSDGVPGTGNPTYNIHGLAPRKGHQYMERDNAYYVIAQKDWDMIGLSAEVFKMGKFYRPYLDYHGQGQGNMVQGELAARNYTIRMPLIEDNDDNDNYADTDYMARITGYRIISFEDPDGVFPGNDEDNDGLPDNNRNNNEIPDYYEEFLMFDAVPDEFVFGDDFNNNTIPDYREDDFKYDTPYDLDHQGYHYSARYTPQEDIDIVVGSMRQDGVGRDWRTYNDYFKAVLNYDVQRVGTISAEYKYQRIRDNIEDPFLRVDINQGEWLELGTTSSRSRFKRKLFADILEYRNSKVNRLFIDSKLRPIPSITIENLVKFESNSQLEGTMYDGVYQPQDVLRTYSMINKLVYTKGWGKLSFSPGINLRFYKKSRDNSVQPLEHYLITIPLVMFKYDISPDTNVQIGFQGIPGFEYSDRDYVSSSNDYKRRTYLLQIENKSVYFGYDVWTGMGFKMDWVEFETDSRAFENYKTSSTFLNVGLGW